MTAVCEIVFAALHARDDAAPHNGAETARHWRALPDLLTLDFYRPAAGCADDPYVTAGSDPAALAMLAFGSLEALDAATRAAAFAAGLAAFGSGALSCTAMLRSDHPVADERMPAALAAPFSYVVRYHRPAEDEALFVRHYVETHPPLLGRLPAIRNVMCYVPLPWRYAGGLPAADYLVGNEVTFDHAEAFGKAMASPVRHELRAHYRAFPPFSGGDTHVAMRRVRLFG